MSIPSTVLGITVFTLALQGQPVAAQKAETLFPHEGPIQGLAFSPGGKFLAAVGKRTDKTGEVILWEVATGKRLARLQGHPSEVKKVAFAAAGKLLATTCKDYLMIWEVPGGKLLSKTAGGSYLGKHGVGRIHDTGVEQWNLDQKKPRKTWRSPGVIQRHALSADGEQLAVLAEGSKGVVLNLATLTECFSFDYGRPDGEAECLAFSPDKQVLAVGTQSDLCLWDLSSGKRLGRFALY